MKATKILGELTVLLLLFCAISVALLGLDGLTSQAIAQQQESVHQQTLRQALPQGTTFQAQTVAWDDQWVMEKFQAPEGTVVVTETEGYQSTIQLYVGVDKDGAVTGVVVSGQDETLGVGTLTVEQGWFLSQFVGKTGELTVHEDIDTVSGATVTAKAITKGVSAAIATVTGTDISSSATEWG